MHIALRVTRKYRDEPQSTILLAIAAVTILQELILGGALAIGVGLELGGDVLISIGLNVLLGLETFLISIIRWGEK